MSIKYRPEIDGLRALAVVPVILFHAGITGFAGGFIGVDVFFVISGYLITSIIHVEIREQRFSIINFYDRRARRILPALFAVCVASITFAWLWMFPPAFDRFAQSVSAVSVFSSNMLFWYHTGYFDTAAELKPLLHTWSLAVEEQFYVVFPLFLFALRRLSRRQLLLVLMSFSIASFSLSQWASETHRSANFYFIFTRAWELGTGAGIAIGLPSAGRLGPLPISNAAAVLGLSLILYSVWAFDATTPFPSVWTLAPVIGSSLIIVFASPYNVVGSILASRPFVSIGLISYSAYLWHQPILAFTRIRNINQPSTWLLLLVCAISLIVAYLSWLVIERPFRNKQRFSRSNIFFGAIATSLALFVFGVVGHVFNGLPSRIDPQAFAMLRWQNDINPRVARCNTRWRTYIQPKKSCVYNGEAPASIAIWGDSHAMASANEIAKSLRSYGRKLRELSYSGCLPILNTYNFGKSDRCTEYTREAYEYLISHPEIKIVIICARYPLRFEGHGYDNGEGGVEEESPVYVLPVNKGRSYVKNPNRINVLGGLARDTIMKLAGHGKRVMIIYPIPAAGWNVPDYLAKEIQFSHLPGIPLTTSYDAFKRRVAGTYEQLDKLTASPKLLMLRTASIFCNTRHGGRCADELHGKPLYADDDHLDSVGAHLLAIRVVRRMADRGWITK